MKKKVSIDDGNLCKKYPIQLKIILLSGMNSLN